jgi:hypothetical protein
MGSLWKIAVPVLLVVLVGGVIFYSQSSNAPKTPEVTVNNTETTPPPPPVAPTLSNSLKLAPGTGNVDTAANAFLGDAAADQARFNAESADASQANSDAQAVTNVNPTYDPNQF